MPNKMLARVVNTGVDGTSLNFDVEVTVLDASGLGTSANVDDEWLLPNPVTVAANASRDDVHDAIAANVVAQLGDNLLKESDVVVIGYGGKGRKGERGNQGRDGRPGGKGNQGAKFRNAWVAGNAYATDDIVGFDGASWIALQDILAGGSQSYVEPDDDATLWGQIASKPPKWRGEWNSSTDRYRPGDVVWVNTAAANDKDKQVQYICIRKHQPASSNKPSPTNLTDRWELFLDTADPPDDGTDGVSFVFKGAWSNGSGYAVNDVVTFESATYICIQAIVPFSSAAITEPDDPLSSTRWKLMTDNVPRKANPFTWESNRRYRVGHLVKRNKTVWFCLQRHQSSNANAPGNDPAFWEDYTVDGNDGVTYRDRGAWLQTVASPVVYEPNDLVTWEGATFLCVAAHTHSGSTDPEPDDLNFVVGGVQTRVWKEFAPRPLKPKGEWNKDTNYRKGDTVRYTRSIAGALQVPVRVYVCIDRVRGVNNGEPPSTTNKWELLAVETVGPTGPQGVTGAGVQGAQGAQGIGGPQGNQGPRGRPGSGGIEICDGNNNGDAIGVGSLGTNAQVDDWFDFGTLTGTVYLWVKLNNVNNGTVFQARASDGTVLASVTIGSGASRRNGWYRGNASSINEKFCGAIALYTGGTNNGGSVKKAKLQVVGT